MPALSADGSDAAHAGLSFEDLVEAYFDCRRTKRNTTSALAFESDLERNLVTLFDELAAGTYRPGPSICFVVMRPKPREVWAAQFRDRIGNGLAVFTRQQFSQHAAGMRRLLATGHA